jgi:hypothetical protein
MLKARGWCNRHYCRWFRHGDPFTLAVGQDPDNPEPCRICHRDIVAKPNKVAPVYCSRRCRNRARYILHRLHATFLSRL